MIGSCHTLRRNIGSGQELDQFVEIVRALEEPAIVFLEHENGNVLALGIGGEESVLTFAGPDGATVHSVGDSNRTDMLVFRCRGQRDEFLGETAVSEATAILAAHEFQLTGECPTSVLWESDW